LFLLLDAFLYICLLQPPQSFLTTMEEYIKEAPRVVDVPAEPLVCMHISHISDPIFFGFFFSVSYVLMKFSTFSF